MDDDPKIRLLTGGDLEVAGVSFAAISGSKPRGLFVALALNANEVQRRDWLANLFWPDASQDAARQNLRMALFQLRQSLPEQWSERIEATPETICLRVERPWIDYCRLLDLIRSEAEGDANVTLLYRGDLLAQFPDVSPEFDAYLDACRTHVRELCLAAVTEQLRHAAREEDLLHFQKRHNFLVGIDPANEMIAEAAMNFWAMLGRPHQVRQVFEAFRESYWQRYEAEPPDSSVKAFETFLQSATDLEARPLAHNVREIPLTTLPWAIRPARLRLDFRMIAFSALGVGAVAVIGVLWFGATSPVGSVFEITRAVVELSDCKIEAAADRYQSNLTEALSADKVGTIVFGELQDRDIARNARVYEVRQTVNCAGTRFRGTTTIIDKTTRAVAWSARHESPDDIIVIDNVFSVSP